MESSKLLRSERLRNLSAEVPHSLRESVEAIKEMVKRAKTNSVGSNAHDTYRGVSSVLRGYFNLFKYLATKEKTDNPLCPFRQMYRELALLTSSKTKA